MSGERVRVELTTETRRKWRQHAERGGFLHADHTLNLLDALDTTERQLAEAPKENQVWLDGQLWEVWSYQGPREATTADLRPVTP